MKPITQQQLLFFVKQFWQPVVLGILGLLLLIQFYSLGASYVELRKVDSKIAQAKDVGGDKEENEANSDQPGLNRPGRGGNNPRHNQNRSPARNIFKEQKVNFQLSAIYLDKVVINGQPHAVGDKIGNATLVEIGVDYAKVEVEGEDNPRTLELFKGGAEPVSRGPSGSPSRRSGPSRSRGEAPRAESPRSSGPPPSARVERRVNMPRPSRAMMDRFRSMSPEERREIGERVRNMSPEERREFFSRMR